MLPNNIVIIPNSKLSQSVITNFNMPEKMLSVYIPVGVSYDSDPQQVEDILIEEALKGADEIKGLRRDPPPIVRFKEFGDCSLNFLLIVRVEEFIDQYLVEHELRKRIFKRFQKEGIEIPFPIRTVYMRRESE
jgi:small-conductance mechanosensitive channel